MRALKPFASDTASLLSGFSARIGEAQTLRRARAEVEAAHREAAASIKARSDFLANMNHELRTPLNAIIGFATMLKQAADYDLSEEKRAEYAQYILQSADLLLGHINLLLEAAALDGDELDVEAGAIDLGETVTSAIKRTRVIAEAAQVTIDNRTPAQAPVAWGDAERVGQAVDHILRTAVRSSSEGGIILVRAIINDEGWTEIAVRDRGAGLSAEALAAISGAFADIHRGLEKSFAASGIELAVAKAFIEMQGGKVAIKSRPGEGALVRLLLPTAEAAADAANGTAQTPISGDTTSGTMVAPSAGAA